MTERDLQAAHKRRVDVLETTLRDIKYLASCELTSGNDKYAWLEVLKKVREVLDK